MSQERDIHAIRNMMIFFIVLTVIGLVLAVSTNIYIYIKAKLDEAEADEPKLTPTSLQTTAAPSGKTTGTRA